MAAQNKYTQKLKGDKVLIIGGSSGIGYGVAEAALENECTVTIASSNPDRLQHSISQPKDTYPSANITGQVCNLNDESTIEQNIQSLLEKVGPGIDHIIHTAGDALAIKPLSEVDISVIKSAGLVRFVAAIFLGKHASKCLNPGPKSSITFTTGSIAERPVPNGAVVNGYVTGMQGVTRGLALDLKPVRVNAVCPGTTDTNLWSKMDTEKRANLFKTVGEKLPIGRAGSVEDVTEAYLFSMKSHNTTGAQLVANGGAFIV